MVLDEHIEGSEALARVEALLVTLGPFGAQVVGPIGGRGWRGLAGASEGVPVLLLALARAVWIDSLHENWERTQGHAPALVLDTSRTLDQVYLQPDASKRVERADPKSLALFARGEQVAHTPVVEAQRLELLLDAGPPSLHSATALRLLVGLIRECHVRRALRMTDFRTLRFDGSDGRSGGIEGLREWLGITSKRSRQQLLEVLESGASWYATWPGGRATGLWTYRYDDSTGTGKQAMLEITVGTVLVPYLDVFDDKARRARLGHTALVPVPELPALVGRPRDYANQLRFMLRLMQEMTERREEIVKHGGVLIQEHDFERLGDECGLATPTRRQLIERWLRDGEDGPALLELTSPGRYLIAENDAYRRERTLLIRTAEASARARKAGRRKRRHKPPNAR